MLVSIPDNAGQCELIRNFIVCTSHVGTLCVGICADKVGNIVGVSCPPHHFPPHLTNGTTRFIQVDMVVTETQEDMAGSNENY